jgi:hypothetical protein
MGRNHVDSRIVNGNIGVGISRGTFDLRASDSQVGYHRLTRNQRGITSGSNPYHSEGCVVTGWSLEVSSRGY